ncbi:MAG: insulinase family protein [Bernardetiaceae bacterium]|nr:insulinase family protein [Bernardetiaceae bacterium]
MKYLIFFLCLFLGLEQVYGQFTTFTNDPTKLKKTILDNGLEVYLFEDPNAKDIFGLVGVRAGGKYDPKDATGMGHYLEHMLFKGTQRIGTSDYNAEKRYLQQIDSLYELLGKTRIEIERQHLQKQINDIGLEAAKFAIPNEFDRLISAIGGEGLNAFTSEELIAYHNSFPPSQVEKWLDIYSERLINPVFRLFQSELETVYEEKNSSEDQFFTHIFNTYSKNFFKNHPYGTQTILGETEHLKNPSLIKMYEYFNTYYVANNMALILSGNFESEEILPLIKEKFGRLKAGEIPAFPRYEEAEFEGREFVKVKYSPIKIGLIGFRTVPNGHKDAPVFDVISYLLSNDNESGRFDKLIRDNQLLAAEYLDMRYNDHAAGIFLFVPKIIGQSFGRAEELIFAEIGALKKGDFTDEELYAAKLNLLKTYQMELESNYSKAITAAQAFAAKQNWEDVISYEAQINSVVRSEVQRVARQYFGNNMLVMHSKKGKPQKEKLEKPNFKSLQNDNESKSEYAEYFEQIPATKPQARFVDFDNEVKTLALSDNLAVHTAKNPYNDIFTLTIRFDIGEIDEPMLAYATEYMGLIGTKKRSASELRADFADIACTYNIYSSESYTYLTLNGYDKALTEALALLQELLAMPLSEPKKVKNLYQNAKAERKVERSETPEIGKALIEYGIYGEKSDYINRLGIKEIKKLEAATLIEVFQKAMTYQPQIFYVGNLPESKLQEAFAMIKWQNNNGEYKQNQTPKERVKQAYKKPQILWIDRKDAVQSQIYFHSLGDDYKRGNYPQIAAFNQYFGGDMAALVFQEIREFRSLAYSVYGVFQAPQNEGNPISFYGYIGCQSDKTNEAIEVMMSLIDSMPEKPQRNEAIRQQLIYSAYSYRPSARQLPVTVFTWKERGYEKDPNEGYINAYKALEFEQITDFYQKQLKHRPILISIVGDGRKIDMEKLRKYAEIIELSEKDILNK